MHIYNKLSCFFIAFILISFASCQKNASETEKAKTETSNDSSKRRLEDFDFYKQAGDTLEFTIAEDTINLTKEYVRSIVDAFPNFLCKNTNQPRGFNYIDSDAYQAGGARQLDDIYLVYAAIQHEINDKNEFYETLVSDLIKLHQFDIRLAYGQRILGTYFTHKSARLYAESIYSALRIDHIENYNQLTLQKQKTAYFKKIRAQAFETFEKRIPYEYHDSKEKEKELHDKLVKVLNELETFIDSDYKLKNFKEINSTIK